METHLHRFAAQEHAPSSLPECIAALLKRLGLRGAALAAGPDSVRAQLGQLDALDVLERHGCSGEWGYGRVEDIPHESFPAILRCPDGAYCLLLSPVRGQQVRVVFPAQSSQPFDCGLDTIQSAHGASYLLCARAGGCAQAVTTEPHWYFGDLELAGQADA